MPRIRFNPRYMTVVIAAVFLCLILPPATSAAPQIESPPLGERWFGISVNNDLSGFYRQSISRLPDGGYRIEGNGSVMMKVMGFTKEASSREIYVVSKSLALKSFEVDQAIGGKSSRLVGRISSSGILLKKTPSPSGATDKLIKVKGDVIPGPALNLYPLMKGLKNGSAMKVLTFDPEESRIKEVKITLMGEEKTPDGTPAIRLRNNLYPFVDNDIWVDHNGNTLLESVRDGLVITKAETPEKLAAFVSGLALSKKDLIFDFSMVRVEPPLKSKPGELKGLKVEIEGYPPEIPLVESGGQLAERTGSRLLLSTGSLASKEGISTDSPDPRYLAPSAGIEADAQPIKAKSSEIVTGQPGPGAQARAIASWTARWVDDTIDDSGTAMEAMTKKTGNCQSHAKLYTALARAAGIPSRFVSGLVSKDGKGFIYHSWAESWIDGRWVPVDPAFDQLPADPTHLAFLEGNTLEEMAPIVSIIGKIRLKVLEER